MNGWQATSSAQKLPKHPENKTERADSEMKKSMIGISYKKKADLCLCTLKGFFFLGHLVHFST